jgi:hypothetical protein
MTDSNHPITPPPELVEQWRTAPEYASALEKLTMVTMTDRRLQEIATQAARWGADEELEACLMEIRDGAGHVYIDETKLRVCLADDIWTARRPHPPSLKEQALECLKNIDDACESEGFSRSDDTDIIRRALELLND